MNARMNAHTIVSTNVSAIDRPNFSYPIQSVYKVIRLNPDWIRLIELLVPLDTRKRGVEGRVRVVFGPCMVCAFTISPKLYLKRLKTKLYSPIRRL